jgi:hypothetical protein
MRPRSTAKPQQEAPTLVDFADFIHRFHSLDLTFIRLNSCELPLTRGVSHL